MSKEISLKVQITQLYQQRPLSIPLFPLYSINWFECLGFGMDLDTLCLVNLESNYETNRPIRIRNGRVCVVWYVRLKSRCRVMKSTLAVYSIEMLMLNPLHNTVTLLGPVLRKRYLGGNATTVVNQRIYTLKPILRCSRG